ncbi:MAG: DUF554 domain-containing protein [Oscillospiraceae bacterium]|nr:DUF554 domain-containing protein [Oscillospiraceae bacterium]
MLGTIVNTIAVAVGGLVGLLFKNKINQRYANIVMKGIGLCIFAIGITSIIKTQMLLVMVLSMVIGSLIGEAVNIHRGIEKLAVSLNKIFKTGSEGASRFAEGFMGAALLFCIGSMTIMGCLESGINHDHTILFSKSLIDLVSAITLAAAMGIGVPFAALFVLVFQGALTLLAGLLQGVLSPTVVTEMSAVGGLLLVALGLNLVDITERKFTVANFLPAVFMPIWIVPLANKLGAVLPF